ncbi:MAG TPA: flagellar hook-basal body complex protein FliE [Bryobacteraceae bacterium]|nr:flagellar hook-basal body complex protein FliE [Bryobacteraceae bacterium]
MPAPIPPVSAAVAPAPAIPAASTSSSPGMFQQVLAGAIQSVEASAQNASASVERFLAGEGEELHTTVLATERAQLTFDLFLQVRNKVVSAYQEIMRMQV